MSLAQEIIFFNTAEYLFNKNRNDYPDDDSCMKIMAAVTNKIYGRDPTDEEALKFAQDNSNLISTKIGNLNNDKYLLNLINIGIRLKLQAAVYNKTVTEKLHRWSDYLVDEGVLLPDTQFTMPTGKELQSIVLGFSTKVKKMEEIN